MPGRVNMQEFIIDHLILKDDIDIRIEKVSYL